MEKLFVTKAEDGYELLDSGEGRKLERFGEVILDRPDPQIIWKKHNPILWKDAKAVFDDGWKGRKSVPPEWNASIGGNTFLIKLSQFKHVGVFPEHVENWHTLFSLVQKANRPVSVLNLFGYTGGASISALRAGASVCHVDGSKSTIEWAKRNAQLSGVAQKDIRWILDDAVSFVRREIRRKRTYDIIVMDPPASGRGPKGEVWKIGDDLPNLIELAEQLLSENPIGVILNGYSAGYSPVSYGQILESIQEKRGGTVSSGELLIEETGTGRFLPAGIYAHWKQ